MKRQLVGSITVLAAASALVVGSAAAATASTAPQDTEVRADFNGDSIADLAVGVPYEDQTAPDDGVVNVIYGTVRGGLVAGGSQVWSQDSAGIAGSSERADHFGTSLAVGNFNGDAFTDLAIGVPEEDQAADDAGAVNVIYGSAAGLTAAGNQVWSQDSADITDANETNDRFGSSLAAGDFDSDGFTDLAIGVPYEDLTALDVGAVNVIYGSPTGLAAAGDEFWSQDSSGIADAGEAGDHFGASLAAADLGRSTHTDLAIGVPLEDVVAADDGAVNVIYGAATTGLGIAGNQIWSQNSTGIGGGGEAGDRFGSSLAAADFSFSGAADLAIGVPFEDQGVVDAGIVHVIYGYPANGLDPSNSDIWSQDTAGINGINETGDRFGSSLAAADFNGSGVADLAIGAPTEDSSAVDDGTVHVIYGNAGGLGVADNQLWSQDSAGILGSGEAGDRFGTSLAAANLGRGNQADLVIGVPSEDQLAADDGTATVIYGSAAGLSSAGNQVWSQNSAGIGGSSEAGDVFGMTVAAG